VAIKVLVVGCGAVAQGPYRIALQRLERQGLITVAGLVDRDLARARAFGSNFRNAAAYDDLGAGLSQSASQLAIIATPAALHAEHAIAALSSANHVLCEKPMALTSGECRRMNAAALEAGRKLSVGMIRRYYPSLVRAKKMIESGKLGELRSFSYREGRQYFWPVASAESFRRKGGSGILFDIGSHVFDTLIWLFGPPRIISHSDDSLSNGIEASCVTHLECSGVTGFVHLSWDYNLANSFEICGSQGKIVVSLDGIDKVVAWKNDGCYLPLPDLAAGSLAGSPPAFSPKDTGDLIYLHLCGVLKSIAGNEEPGIDGEDGLAIVEEIEACYQAAGPIDMDWLPVEQNDSFKKLHWRQPSCAQ
jgi:predicted dehydrogenase